MFKKIGLDFWILPTSELIMHKILTQLSRLLFSHHHHPTTLLLQPDYAAAASKGTTADAIASGVGDVKLVNGKKQLKVDLEGKSELIQSFMKHHRVESEVILLKLSNFFTFRRNLPRHILSFPILLFFAIFCD